MPLELLYTYAIFFTLLSFLAAPASADPSNSGRAVIQGRSAEGLPPAKARGFQEEFMEEKARLGSIPPNCRNKCNACSPCEAIQVPTLPAHGRIHWASQSPTYTIAAAASTTGASKKYSNYKPMGWKCKCGNHLFNP